MMLKFHCWCPDDGDEDSADTIEAVMFCRAAEEWARIHWGDLDHPDEIEVCVRLADGTGVVAQYTVEVEKTVEFSAWPSNDGATLATTGQSGGGG